MMPSALLPASCMALRKLAEPEWAMVPMFSTSSASVMPMPLSEMVRSFLSLSASMRICKGASSPSSEPLAASEAVMRSLSKASEALDTSSRRKISRSVYREWTRISSSCLISALNS